MGQGSDVQIRLVVRRIGAATDSSSAILAAGGSLQFSYRAPEVTEIVVKDIEDEFGLSTGFREITVIGSSFGPSPQLILNELPQ